MDRGLAHSSAMLRALSNLGVDYIVRVKSNARFTSRTGVSQLLKHWMQRGRAVWLRGRLFDRDHACDGQMLLLWEDDHADGWCLFTNLHARFGRYYALRWWQEQSFRDLKSYGLQWTDTHLTCPTRLSRLLFPMAIAYAFCIAAGTRVCALPIYLKKALAPLIDPTRLSLFRLGRYFLNAVLNEPFPLSSLSLSFPILAFFIPSLKLYPPQPSTREGESEREREQVRVAAGLQVPPSLWRRNLGSEESNCVTILFPTAIRLRLHTIQVIVWLEPERARYRLQLDDHPAAW